MTRPFAIRLAQVSCAESASYAFVTMSLTFIMEFFFSFGTWWRHIDIVRHSRFGRNSCYGVLLPCQGVRFFFAPKDSEEDGPEGSGIRVHKALHEP
jgi:hypothetical protein